MASDTAYPVFQHYGTNAQRLAFTPAPAAGTQPTYLWYETDTDNFYIYTTAWKGPYATGGGSGTVTNTGTLTSGQLIQGNGGVDVTVNATTATVTKLTSGVPSAATAGTDYVNPTYLPMVCNGRLTTESGVPLSTADRTAQGTIYFTPCTPGGTATTTGAITLYSGSALVLFTFTQLSLGLTVTSGKNYDVFVDYNGGTPQLVLSAAWTTDTARADALANQSGLIVKSGTTTYRWIGTIRASGANVTEDSMAKRFVWNATNQLPRLMQVLDGNNSWNYSTAAYQQADNGTAANQLDYVVGDAGTWVTAVVNVQTTNTTAQNVRSGVGIDSTTVNSANTWGTGADGSAKLSSAQYWGYPGLGRHTLVWLEYGSGSGTNTWYGDNGGTFQSGIFGTVLG